MHLAGGLIRSDSWGFPIIVTDAIEAKHLASARAAVRGCPRKALMLKAVPGPGRASARG